MSIEFNPIPGRADIISRMADSGEEQKIGKPSHKRAKSTRDDSSSEKRMEKLRDVQDRFAGEFRPGMSAVEAEEVAKKAKPADVVFQTDIELHGGIKFPVTVERRSDESLVMNDLPPNRYDRELVTRIVRGAGIVDEKEEVQLPEDWDDRSKQSRKAYLKVRYGIDSMDAPLNINPAFAHTTRPGGPPIPDSFRELLLEKWADVGVVIGPQTLRQQELDTEIVDRINSGDAQLVLGAVRDLQEIKTSIEGDPTSQAELDQLFPPFLQAQLYAEEAALNTRYEAILSGFNSRSRVANLGDIDNIGASELQAVSSGWHGIDQAVEQILAVARSRQEIPSQRGLREWYAYQKLNQVEEGFQIQARTQVSPDAEVNIRNVETVMRLFEKTKTPENFGHARDSLNRLLHAIELSDAVSEHRKEALRKRLDAFEIVNSLLIRMDVSEGDPKQMLEVSRNYEDETHFYFYDRFKPEEVVDTEGRPFMVDTRGSLLDINILSEAENAFAYQYLVDRFRVNNIQRLQGQPLDVGRALAAEGNVSYNDERLIIEKLVDFKGRAFADLGIDPVFRDQVQQELNDTWSDESKRKGALKRWYAEETFMGADGYDLNSGLKRIDVWQDKIMQTVFRKRLIDAGVDSARVVDLLGNLNAALPYDFVTNRAHGGDEELIAALKRNGYDLAKYVYADSVDKLEFYDNEGVHEETLFGEETPYLARVVTSFMDFALSEAQGDARVNRIVMDVLEDQWSGTPDDQRSAVEGWLLPQNMTAFRILMQGGGELLNEDATEQLGADLKRETDEERVAKAGRLGTDKVHDRDVAGYVFARRLFEGINPDLETVNDQFAQIDWAKASAKMKRFDIADMLEDRMKSSEWFMGSFRTWLNHPTDAEFLEMTKKYYSARNVRKHPGTADYLQMQWLVGHHWENWFDYDHNISSAEMEGFIAQARELNLVDKDRGDALKRKLLGPEPIQSLNQLFEVAQESLRSTIFEPGWYGGTIADFFKTLWKFIKTAK